MSGLPRVAIVGCGLAGVSAAETLIRQGVGATVFDMGENPGGRLAVRDITGTGTRADGEVVDIGAAYFTVSDADFGARVADWSERGLAHSWFDTCTLIDELGSRRVSGPVRFASSRGNRSLVVNLVEVLSVKPSFELRLGSRVESVRASSGGVLVDGDEFDAAILAMPDAQALRILDETAAPALSAQLAGEPWVPAISHTMVFADRTWGDDDFWFVNNSAIIANIADNGRRRRSDAPVLVSHSTAEHARTHFDDPDSAGPAMTAAVRDLLGITREPVHTITRRWGLAHPAAPRIEECGWDQVARIAVCGDGWHGKPRMEAAFLSGKAAALKVLAAVSE